MMSLTSAREAAPNGFVGLDVSVSSSDARLISKRWPRMIALKSMLSSPQLCDTRLVFNCGCLKFFVHSNLLWLYPYLQVVLYNTSSYYIY